MPPPRLSALVLLLTFLTTSTAASLVPASPVAYTTHDPVAAVSGLITRLLGPSVLARFQLEAIPVDASGLDVLETDSSGALVVLRGNTGVALATALNNYLKYQCVAGARVGCRTAGSILQGRGRGITTSRLPQRVRSPVMPHPRPLQVQRVHFLGAQ